MVRKKKPHVDHYPADWVVSHHLVVNGRHVEPGTELTISGIPGRCRFVKHVKTGTTVWVDIVGGKKGAPKMRSVTPDRIKTVHRINKTRENAKA